MRGTAPVVSTPPIGLYGDTTTDHDPGVYDEATTGEPSDGLCGEAPTVPTAGPYGDATTSSALGLYGPTTTERDNFGLCGSPLTDASSQRPLWVLHDRSFTRPVWQRHDPTRTPLLSVLTVFRVKGTTDDLCQRAQITGHVERRPMASPLAPFGNGGRGRSSGPEHSAAGETERDDVVPTLRPVRHPSSCLAASSRHLGGSSHRLSEPGFRGELIGIIKHGAKLGYSGPLRQEGRPSDGVPNLPIEDAFRAHVRSSVAQRESIICRGLGKAGVRSTKVSTGIM